MKYLLLIVSLCLSIQASSQVKGLLLHGTEHIEEGYIEYEQGYKHYLYFTLNQNVESVRVYAHEITGFVTEQDTFKVLHDFYIKNGFLKTHYPVGFAKQIVEDSVSLYLHQHLGKKSTSQGDALLQMVNTINNYFIKFQGELIPINSSKNQFKQQISKIFSQNKVLQQAILNDKYTYNDIDTIVRIYNRGLKETTTP